MAEASPAATGAGATMQQEKATFATILSFVEGSVLDTTETVEQNQDSGTRDTRAGCWNWAQGWHKTIPIDPAPWTSKLSS